MLIQTSAGNYTITKSGHRRLRVTACDYDALQAAIDCIATMAGGEEIEPDQPNSIETTEDVVADWLRVEVLEYIKYDSIEGMHEKVY